MKEILEGYIFDLDDTLYCEHDYVRSGFLTVAEEISKHCSKNHSDIIQDMLINEWKQNGRGKVFNKVCEKLELSLEIPRLVSIYRNHQPQIELYEDAKQILSLLKVRNKKIGMITDGNSVMQWRKIESLGIRSLCQCIIVTGDLGESFWKPSEIPYKSVVDCLNLSYEQCVYIGDNPNKDFITARKLGMHTVRIIRPSGDHMKTRLSNEYEADRTISSLNELID